MDSQVMKSINGFGLLASGSSRLWDIAIDESLACENEWSAEIEGPNMYLVFQLHDLEVIYQALDFLQKHLSDTKSQGRLTRTRQWQEDSLTIGRFGHTSVSLVWDTEDFIRCFLVIGLQAKSTVRFSFQEEDIQMLVEALQEVVQEL